MVNNERFGIVFSKKNYCYQTLILENLYGQISNRTQTSNFTSKPLTTKHFQLKKRSIHPKFLLKFQILYFSQCVVIDDKSLLFVFLLFFSLLIISLYGESFLLLLFLKVFFSNFSNLIYFYFNFRNYRCVNFKILVQLFKFCKMVVKLIVPKRLYKLTISILYIRTSSNYWLSVSFFV